MQYACGPSAGRVGNPRGRSRQQGARADKCRDQGRSRRVPSPRASRDQENSEQRNGQKVADVGEEVEADGLDAAEILEQPAVRLLRQILQSPAWRRELKELDGYASTPGAGDVLSLTRALPWWTFRTPRTSSAAAPRS